MQFIMTGMLVLVNYCKAPEPVWNTLMATGKNVTSGF